MTMVITECNKDLQKLQAVIGNYTCELGSLTNDRDSNEDSAAFFTTANNILVGLVCDGLGGHEHGELASWETAQYIIEQLQDIELTPENFQSVLQDITDRASDLLVCHGDNRDTTLTLAAVFPGEISVLQVGDSSAALTQDLAAHRTVPQGSGNEVFHTVGGFFSSPGCWSRWKLTPREQFRLVLATDGCDHVGGVSRTSLDAYALCEKAAASGKAGRRDNATAVTIAYRP